jgi:predicted ATPase
MGEMDKELVRWTIIIDQEKNNWKIYEKMENLTTNKELYPCDFMEQIPSLEGHPETLVPIPNASARNFTINVQSSVLKYFNGDQDTLLLKLKEFLAESNFLGLLSPDSIRKGDGRTYVDSIGINGTSLSANVHSMSSEDRKFLNNTVSKYVGFNLRIKTVDVGKKIELYIEEKFDVEDTRINKDHISDGLLRIISFVAISMEKQTILLGTENGSIVTTESGNAIVMGRDPIKNGMILLDEIEDGINPYLTDKIIKLLEKTAKDSKRQVIATTHSPVILNDVGPESIVFLWKETNGSVHARKFFGTEEMKSLLDALNPGEVWLNLDKEEILERLYPEKEGNK